MDHAPAHTRLLLARGLALMAALAIAGVALPVGLRGDALPFVVFLLLIALGTAASALWPALTPARRTAVWLTAALLLALSAALAILSIGVFLVPALALLLLAALLPTLPR